MSASLRVSRGFHRLGLFLAALPFVAGISFAVVLFQDHNSARHKHDRLICAYNYVQNGMPDPPPSEASKMIISLKQIGCSDRDWDTVSYHEAANPSEFTWWDWLNDEAPLCILITLAISLAVYGLVRAIGWVIGGFAAS
jgi:hypothetical protein